jgi:hypothetical protein
MTASYKAILVVLLASLGGSAICAANAADESQVQPETSPPPVTTILHHPESVLGKRLIGKSGQNAGRIADVLTDEYGHVRAVVVDYGGFLGIGTRKVAVAWSDLRFGLAGHPNSVAVDLSPEYLARAPEVRKGQPVIAVTAQRWRRAEQN